MNSLYYQKRKASIFNDLGTYLMSPDEFIGLGKLENKSPWSSVQFNPARHIITGKKCISTKNQIRGHVSLFFEDKPAPTVFKSEIRESIIDIDKLDSEENLEFDIFIKMLPVKEQTKRIRVKSIESGKMHIVEPE